VLIAAIGLGLYLYWDALEPSTRVPAGAVALAFFAGLKWVFAARHHRLKFVMTDGRVLRWKSRSGDFVTKQGAVDKVPAFGRSYGRVKERS
jgi:hypothetical protein